MGESGLHGPCNFIYQRRRRINAKLRGFRFVENSPVGAVGLLVLRAQAGFTVTYFTEVRRAKLVEDSASLIHSVAPA